MLRTIVMSFGVCDEGRRVDWRFPHNLTIWLGLSLWLPPWTSTSSHLEEQNYNNII